MEIKLYKTDDDSRHLIKKLTDELSLIGEVKTELNILTPTILIELSDTDISKYNYCYIPNLKRYYFINQIQSYRQNLIAIDLKVDVLMSYSTDILSMNCYVIKNATFFDAYKNNNEYALKCYPRILTKRFSNDTAVCNNSSCVIATVGGN